MILKRGPKGQDRKTVGWRIRRDVLDKLDAECQRQGAVQALVVEQALEAMLAHVEEAEHVS